jgi:hypothetical protein
MGVNSFPTPSEALNRSFSCSFTPEAEEKLLGGLTAVDNDHSRKVRSEFLLP